MNSEIIEVKNLLSNEAYEFLKQDNIESYLIDVRTKEEWENIGSPDLSGINKEVIFLSWRISPFMQINECFKEELSELIPNKDANLFFICRSGARSFESAFCMIDYGYKNCYNISDGFEGKSPIPSNSAMGWKRSKLPCK